MLCAHGNDHTPTNCQLIDQRLWNLFRGRGHEYGVEWGMLRPAGVAVADPDGHIVIAHPPDIVIGTLAQTVDNLDRVEIPGDLRVNGRMIDGPGAELEN